MKHLYSDNLLLQNLTNLIRFTAIVSHTLSSEGIYIIVGCASTGITFAEEGGGQIDLCSTHCNDGEHLCETHPCLRLCCWLSHWSNRVNQGINLHSKWDFSTSAWLTMLFWIVSSLIVNPSILSIIPSTLSALAFSSSASWSCYTKKFTFLDLRSSLVQQNDIYFLLLALSSCDVSLTFDSSLKISSPYSA